MKHFVLAIAMLVLWSVVCNAADKNTSPQRKKLKGRGIPTKVVLLQSNAGQTLYDNWVRRTQGQRR